MIDSHAHLTSPQVITQAKEEIARAKEVGVEKIINICTDWPSLEGGIELAKKFPFIYNTAATTPHDVEADGESFFPLVAEHIDKLVAVGETGLDYFYEHSPKKIQQKFLERYLALAVKSSLPIVFHCRRAFSDLFAITDSHALGHPALLHCFTGTLEEARGCLDRGFFLSFSGIITYKKSELLREVVKFAPLDRIVIETDTPYLAPQSQRGKENEPSFIIETAEKVAELKGLGLEEVGRITGENAIQFFALK